MCGIVVHEGCRAILSTPCAKAGSMRLSYRYAAPWGPERTPGGFVRPDARRSATRDGKRTRAARFAEEVLLPYGAYNDLMKLVSDLVCAL